MANRIKKVNNKGQALVEFALSILVLIVFVFGIFEVGRLFHMKIVMVNAAREGARYLIRHPSDASAGFPLTKNAVINEANNYGIDLGAAIITAECSDNFNVCKISPNKDTYVTITLEVDVDVGIVSNLFGIITMEEVAIMRVPK